MRSSDLAAVTLLVLASLLALGACERPRSTARHLLLVTVDTLRADRVGAYGARSGATPRMDALAARGLVHERAFAEVPLTLPSHATILTGLHPTEHGIRYHGGYRLADEERTLAEELAEAGFETGAVLGAFVLSARFGLDQGFASYDAPEDEGPGPAGERRGDRVTERAIAWLDRPRPAGQRTFLWVHYWDPHSPYSPPEPFRSQYGDPYDGEVATADAALGVLLDAYAARGLLDDTLVVVVADHGEALGEHGEDQHGFFLYDATLRVPLIVAGPGVSPGRTDELTPLSRVPALCLAGLGFEATSLRGPARVDDPLPADRAYAETYMPRAEFGWSALRAWRDSGRKLVEAPRPELYDLVADPRETRDLLAGGARPGEVETLAGELRAFLHASRGTADARRSLSAEEEAQLRALGYAALGSGRATDDAVRAEDPDPKDMQGVLRSVVAARQALQRGDLAGATRLYDEALAADPSNISALLDRGELHRRAESWGPLERNCRRVLELVGDAAWGSGFRERAHAGVATAALGVGDAAIALIEFEAVRVENPDNVEAVHATAALLLVLGRRDEARERFELGLRMAPDDGRFRRALAALAPK